LQCQLAVGSLEEAEAEVEEEELEEEGWEGELEV
jgi:hypothetical protein